MATTAYHGLDSNSNPANDPCHDDFYLGAMGMGAHTGDTQVYNSYYCMQFNNYGDTGNTNAYSSWMVQNQRTNTYGYWFLLGPMFANPDSSTSTYSCNGTTKSGYRSYTVNTLSEAYAWGQAQADAAYSAWSTSYPDIMRNTIYCDVEQGESAGWYPSSFGVINGYNWNDLNTQVILGFLQQINSKSMVGGVYSSPGDWSTITNNYSGLGNYTSHVWVADWGSNTDTSCLPAWQQYSIGGVNAQIWQYHGGSTLDLDAALSLPS